VSDTRRYKAQMSAEDQKTAKMPSGAVECLIEKLDLFKGVDLLLYSPGREDVADRVRDACPSAAVSCVEPAVTIRQRLRLSGYELMDEGDFLKIDCWPWFDRIASIPPTTNGQEIKYLQHAFTMLKPGGRLVAGITERSLDQTRGLQKRLQEVHGEIEYLPSGLLFEECRSATARAYLVIITRPEESAIGSAITAAKGKVLPATAAGA
jgi:hypothetical protein